jgi:NAD(P)-dependent dehydrogenase (short-subunit alcohol dehydrogenase family)
VAIVTGARVKIGYQAAIKLLRAGARVIVTTRFPHDAARATPARSDFEAFRGRLEIHGLDLRHTPSVEPSRAPRASTARRLDFILHNACQTVRRPPGFYRHLVDRRRMSRRAPAQAEPLLRRTSRWKRADSAEAHARAATAAAAWAVGIVPSAAALAGRAGGRDDHRARGALPGGAARRRISSSVDLRDAEQLAAHARRGADGRAARGAARERDRALRARRALKPLMLRPDPVKGHTRDKHIVNVSAMEGQFYREHKTDKHPHTNMAKAALNMMTRTSAADYVRTAST